MACSVWPKASAPNGEDRGNNDLQGGIRAGLDRDVLVALLSRGVRAVERLRRADPAWLGEIAELRLGREDRIEVLLGPSQPTILLDPKKVERNVGAYLELRREIEQRTGSLASVDLRWRDRISVIPRASGEDS